MSRKEGAATILFFIYSTVCSTTKWRASPTSFFSTRWPKSVPLKLSSAPLLLTRPFSSSTSYRNTKDPPHFLSSSSYSSASFPRERKIKKINEPFFPISLSEAAFLPSHPFLPRWGMIIGRMVGCSYCFQVCRDIYPWGLTPACLFLKTLFSSFFCV